jgi:uncharacterized protein DUF4304
VSTHELFEGIVGGVEPILSEHGFERADRTFYRVRNGNWNAIEIQESVQSLADGVRFTINVGTCSERLRKFTFQQRVGHFPMVDECQWKTRIGGLLPERRDKWWLVSNASQLREVITELRRICARVILPAFDSHQSDEQLRDLWLTGKSLGRTELERLVFLAVLLQDLGPQAEYEKLVQHMRRDAEKDFLVAKHLDAVLRRAENSTG